jgi:hypothetical protein
MKTRTKRNAGLSLIEVMIASMILLVVVVITMSILFTATTTVNRDSRASGLQHRGRTLLEYCRDQFYTGMFRFPGNNLPPTDPTALGIFDQNTQARYQVPVGQHKDPTTGVLTGAMDFGYTTNMGKDDDEMMVDPATKVLSYVGPRTCLLRFEADTVFWESLSALPATVSQPVPVGSPSTLPPLPVLAVTSRSDPKANILNADANKNGNRNDTYVRGKIKKYVLWSAAKGQKVESFETLDDYVMLAVDPLTGQFNGRIDPITGPANPSDSDGVYRGDWLFRYVNQAGDTDWLSPFPVTSKNNPNLSPTIGIQVTVSHGDWDENRKGFLIWRDRETIRFRNPQDQ